MTEIEWKDGESPLVEPDGESLAEVAVAEPFKVGDKVRVKDRSEVATVHQIFGNGDVLEVTIPSVIYLTVSKDIVSRGN